MADLFVAERSLLDQLGKPFLDALCILIDMNYYSYFQIVALVFDSA
jgi:hypothetical protein